MGQIAKQVSEKNDTGPPGGTVNNPRESCKAISTRSGRVVGAKETEDVDEELEEGNVEREELTEEKKQENKRMAQTLGKIYKGKEKIFASCGRKSNKETLEEADKHYHISPHASIPFPQQLKKQPEDKKFAKFVELLQNLKITMPFSETITQMPTYAKFMKELISNKRRITEDLTVPLSEECSAIIQSKLPTKIGDKGPVTIPCSIGTVQFRKALIDLGASINLMPLSVSKKLKEHELKPTKMQLLLADRSTKRPCGVLEDLLVQVDKLTFPADFVVLDMEADLDVPIILGRPFLLTARAMINMADGELILRVGNDNVIFNLFDAMQFPLEKTCMKIDLIDSAVTETSFEIEKLENLLLEDTVTGESNESEPLRDQFHKLLELHDTNENLAPQV